MPKPTGTPVLDTGHALYANIAAFWAFMEGAGRPEELILGTACSVDIDWTSISGELVATWGTSETAGGVSPQWSDGSRSFGTAYSMAWRGRLAGSTVATLFGRLALALSTASAEFTLNQSAASTNQVRVALGGSAVNSQSIGAANTFAALHDYLLIRNGTAWELWVDGVQTATGTLGASASDTNANPWKMGWVGGGSGVHPTSMSASQAIFFDKALAGAEITNHFADIWGYLVSTPPEITVDDEESGATVVDNHNQHSTGGADSTAASATGIYVGTIKNEHATENRTIDSIGVVGDHTLLTDPTPIVLAPGQTADFEVQLDTTKVPTAFLTPADPYESVITITYSGTGVALSPFLMTLQSTLAEVQGGVFYIDPENGLPSNSGRVLNKAMQYSPEDTKATDVEAAVTIPSGTPTRFSLAHVKHPVEIVRQVAGTAGNLVTYDLKDTLWGAGVATFWGGVAIDDLDWVAAADQDDAFGSPDWADCWVAPLPASCEDLCTYPVHDGTVCAMARGPLVGADIYKVLDESNMWTTDQANVVSGGGGVITIQDVVNFAGLPSGLATLGKSFFGLHVTPNIFKFFQITAYDSGTNTVTLSNPGDVDTPQITGSNATFFLWNSGAMLTQELGFATDIANQKIVMKRSAAAPTNVEVSIPRNLFDINGKGYTRLQGGGATQFVGGFNDTGKGYAVFNSAGSGVAGVEIDDFETYDGIHLDAAAAIKLSNLAAPIVNVEIHDTMLSKGIHFVTCSSPTLNTVEVDHTGGSGILFYDCPDPVLNDCDGGETLDPHSTSYIFYSGGGAGCSNVIANRCRGVNSYPAVAIEDCDGYQFNNCYFRSDGHVTFSDWGGSQNGKLYNSIVLRDDDQNNAVNIDPSSRVGHEMINCTLDGVAGWSTAVFTNNICRGLSAGGDPQNAGNGWDSTFLTANAIQVIADLDTVFVNLATHNYALLAGSPAIDAGVDVGLAYSGAAPDIGATEWEPALSGATPDGAMSLGLGLGI